MATNKFLTILAGVPRLVQAISASIGAADGNKLVSTRSDGVLDPSLLNLASAGAIGATTISASGTTPSTSTTTGAVVVAGGVGVGGALWAGSVISPIVGIRNNGFTSSFTAALTGNHAYTLPNRSGKMQLLRGDNPLCELFSHFIEGAGGWNTIVNGTAAAVSFVTITDTSAPGIAQLSTGTSATARAGLATAPTVVNGTTLLASLKMGSGESDYLCRVRIPVASDATDTYLVRAGFFLSTTVTETTSGIFFRYVSGTSANWQIVVRNAGVETAVTTGVFAPFNAWQNLAIVVNAAGTSVEFFIDGVAVTGSPITTNIPVNNLLGAGIVIVKTAGTTARTIEADLQYVGVGL